MNERSGVLVVDETLNQFFFNKKRIATFLLLWFNKYHLTIQEMLQVLLNTPITFEILVDGILLFKGFHLSYRELNRLEIMTLYNQLKKHHYKQVKLFECDISTNGFSLRYYNYKYNSLLNKYYDPMIFLKVLIKRSTSYFLKPKHVDLVKQYYREVLKEMAKKHLLKGHPRQRKLLHLITKI